MRYLKITRQIKNNNSTALDMYLCEVGNIELLSTEKEEELARRISEGDQQALDALIKANLRFVVSVANQYRNQGLSLPDLINEGNLGLITAAERFDKTRGFKFISYAVWWIRHSILQAIDENSRIVRLPVNKIGLKSKMKKMINHLSHEYFREPTINELSEAMGLQPEIVENAMYILTVNVSMDEPVGDEEENNRYDLVMNNDSLSPESGLITESLQKEIERTLTNLSSREANILRRFFGLNGFVPQPLENIGVDIGLTRERVRQIKEHSLKKLKIRTHSNNLLKEYMSC
jgi:RNA polymerase primary sigma factor